jgi:tRNA/rRNA methyltransferase
VPTHPLQPVFILVNPQMGENIGACARAMLNCGLSDLRIVDPRDGWPNEKADAMSAGALDVIPPVKVFATLQEAIADCQYILSSAANERDMIKPIITAREAARQMVTRLEAGEKVAVLLGRERSGLTNDEVALTHAMISIPVNADFNSLNIGQAALVIAYEYAQMVYDAPGRILPTGKTGPATADEFDNFCKRLEEEIETGGFFKAIDMKPTVLRNIRSFFMRAEPTTQELNTLHGIITALKGK